MEFIIMALLLLLANYNTSSSIYTSDTSKDKEPEQEPEILSKPFNVISYQLLTDNQAKKAYLMSPE